jgi:hypothetical protein
MNWKNGLLRVWASLAVIWIILIFALMEVPQNAIAVSNHEESLTDLTGSEMELTSVENQILTVRYGARTWEVHVRDLRTQFNSEYPLEQVAVHLNQNGAIHNAHQRLRISMLRHALLIALAPVVILLLLGMVGFWVARGFRRTEQ